MIKLVPSHGDDAGFLSLIQRIVNGTVSVFGTHEVYVVQTKNWFDFKWPRVLELDR
jgi:hypothetical protein